VPSINARSAFLERRLPLIPDRAAAVALAGFRSLLRAPEIKLAILGQVLVLVIIGSANLSRTSEDMPELLRPLLAAGCMLFVLITMMNLIGNQFGLDRNGFRTYMLSAAPRRDILLGKNLAALPLALTLPMLALIAIQVVRPMRLDHVLGVVPQMLTMYMVFCMLANWLSIYAPIRLRTGTLRAAQPRALTLLLHFAFLFSFPIALAPTFVPLLMEFLLTHFAAVNPRLPIYLLLSLPVCAIVALLYHLCLHLQGRALQAREIDILQTVSIREE
jgi:hypothetical protein